jgi:hypothetical protein
VRNIGNTATSGRLAYLRKLYKFQRSGTCIPTIGRHAMKAFEKISEHQQNQIYEFIADSSLRYPSGRPLATC